MTNLARGGVILTLILMTAAFFYSETKTDAALIANDSKGNIQQNDETEKTDSVLTTDNNQKEITINIDNIEDLQTTSNQGNIENSDKSSALSLGKALGMAFTATAYCLQGRTATGGGVRRGIVAADPRVLPLGTRININAGSYSGSYVVADTGGGVKGRRLDVWVPSCSEARRFGRKSVSVSVGGK